MSHNKNCYLILEGMGEGSLVAVFNKTRNQFVTLCTSAGGTMSIQCELDSDISVHISALNLYPFEISVHLKQPATVINVIQSTCIHRCLRPHKDE